MRTVARIGISLVVVTLLASVVRVRDPGTPPPAPAPTVAESATIAVNGFAYWGDTAALGPTSVLRVWLIDLMSDTPTAVVATSTLDLAQVRQSVAWSLRVPIAKRHVAHDGLLVVSISDDQQVRYVGTQSARPVAPPPSTPDRAGPLADEPSPPASIRWVRLQGSASGGDW